MSNKYKFLNPEGIYFVTSTTVQWVDLFTRPVYKDTLIESLEFCQKKKGLNLHAFCIMTNHVHFIFSCKGTNSFSDIMRDYKKFTSVKLIELIQQNQQESRKNWLLWIFGSAGRANSNNKYFQVWQQDNHPVELTTNQMIDQRLEYIHHNPVKEGYVQVAEDWIYSSAINYAGGQGIINVDLIE